MLMIRAVAGETSNQK